MTVDQTSIFDDEKKPGQRELPRVELTKELLDSVRHIEGFPIGTDEDIIRLSDPPYYTACPNPFLNDFVCKSSQPFEPTTDFYHREPFAADVSEGKNNPVYTMHTYHTKVPHRAIMRYLLHYTEPGDIVLDGFCGTGMVGVAARLCGSEKEIRALGYTISEGGIVTSSGGSATKYRLGGRRVVLNDLSPAATFIAYNHVSDHRHTLTDSQVQRTLESIRRECQWMYTTLRPEYSGEADLWAQRIEQASPDEIKGLLRANPNVFASVSFTLWSDVFICPTCSHEITYWNHAVCHEKQTVLDVFPCSSCGSVVSKRSLSRAKTTERDDMTGEVVTHAKQVPCLVYASTGSATFEKPVDAFDVALVRICDSLSPAGGIPVRQMPRGYNTEQPRRSHGYSHVHHFFTRRNLIALGKLSAMIEGQSSTLKFILSSLLIRATRMNTLHVSNFFFRGGGINAGHLKGTLYVPSLSVETSVVSLFQDRAAGVTKGLLVTASSSPSDYIISTQSSATLDIPDKSVDYIFVDPPFGSNIMYSELNVLWEAWLGVVTEASSEAIENKAQGKGPEHYQQLMEACFKEFYRVLKPGRWMSVEFHNSSNRIWNLIQESIGRAGFVIADIRVLDKKQKTFRQSNSAGAVKQDLVISAYRPGTDIKDVFELSMSHEDAVWLFMKSHLAKLPVVVVSADTIVTNPERQNYLLFDRMVAYFIQHGHRVPMSASNFYAGLKQRFTERDGMFFLPAQAAEYDGAKARSPRMEQLVVFVTDEKSAILWIRRELEQRKQTFGELQPNFMRHGQPQRHEKMPDLQQILEQNFLKDSEGRWYVPDVNRQADLEKLRDKELLREFAEYLNTKGKLKVFRTEAVSAGFKHAWAARDFATIVSVAKKIPEAVLQEDSALLMYYDNARTRLED